jgi:hypothetical protein
VHEFFHETDDERNRDGLMSTWRYDVQLVRAPKELVNVEGCLSGRGTCRLSAHAREEAGGRGPDARSLAFFGREDTAQQRHGRMMLAVTIVQFVQEIVAPSLVDASGELTQ